MTHSPTVPRRWLRSPARHGRLIVGLLCLGVLCSLTTLVHASPPDPTWMSGLYDDGDHDDAVLLATSVLGVLDGASPTIAGPARSVGEPSPSLFTCYVSPPRCSESTRAPPGE